MITYLNYILPLKKLVTDMRRAGLPIYKPNREAITQRITDEAKELQDALDETAGYHINVDSRDVNHFLFNDMLLKRPKRYDGKDSADNETLSELDASYNMEVLRLIPELRTKYKILSTVLDPVKFASCGGDNEIFPCK